MEVEWKLGTEQQFDEGKRSERQRSAISFGTLYAPNSI